MQTSFFPSLQQYNGFNVKDSIVGCQKQLFMVEYNILYNIVCRLDVLFYDMYLFSSIRCTFC